MQIASAIFLSVFIHISAMALCARELGIGVRSVTYGIGPVLLRIGRWQLALLPLGGQVRLVTVADAGKPGVDAFERQSAWVRVLLALSGPLALLGLGNILIGSAAFGEVRDGMVQLVRGAVDPFGTGQELLQAATRWQPAGGMAAVVGTVACRFAGLNLLPYLGSNGMQAIDALLPVRLAETGRLRRLLAAMAVVLTLLLLGGWMLALMRFSMAAAF